jgi:hypothetical protein
MAEIAAGRDRVTVTLCLMFVMRASGLAAWRTGGQAGTVHSSG